MTLTQPVVASAQSNAVYMVCVCVDRQREDRQLRAKRCLWQWGHWSARLAGRHEIFVNSSNMYAYTCCIKRAYFELLRSDKLMADETFECECSGFRGHRPVWDLDPDAASDPGQGVGVGGSWFCFAQPTQPAQYSTKSGQAYFLALRRQYIKTRISREVQSSIGNFGRRGEAAVHSGPLSKRAGWLFFFQKAAHWERSTGIAGSGILSRIQAHGGGQALPSRAKQNFVPRA